MKIKEIISYSTFPEPPDLNRLDRNLWNGANLIKQVSENLFLYENSRYYFLTKNKDILGFIKLSQQDILNQTYEHVDAIYVKPQFRNTSAIKWLIFSVKQLVTYPVIADGAIFPGGNSLIQSIINHQIFKVSLLNKETGEKTPITHSGINDLDSCYIFEYGDIGFGKQYFPEGAAPYFWYNFIESIK